MSVNYEVTTPAGTVRCQTPHLDIATKFLIAETKRVPGLELTLERVIRSEKRIPLPVDFEEPASNVTPLRRRA